MALKYHIKLPSYDSPTHPYVGWKENATGTLMREYQITTVKTNRLSIKLLPQTGTTGGIVQYF